jgi:hypothetical protein
MTNAAIRRRGDDDVPDIDDEAIECLAGTQLKSFTASPTTIEPFQGPVTLRWSASVPVGCRVVFQINGRAVGRSGSLEVLPAADTTYSLTASARGASRVLGRVAVNVDTSACVSGELAESMLRGQVEQSLTAFEADDDRAYDLSLDSFEIRSTGLYVFLHMKLEIDNFADPTVYVDFVIGLNVDDGLVRPYYRSFTTDVDWPWYITTVTLGVTKIVEEFLDNRVEGDMKPKVLEKIQGVIDGLVGLLPDDMKIHTIRLTEDAIVVTACPDGDVIPSRVLALPAGARTVARA